MLGALVCAGFSSCQQEADKLKLVILEPGHFHAALVQKESNPDLADEVFVYAPQGAELDAYLALVEGYNTREEAPTAWVPTLISTHDYLDQFSQNPQGDIVVLAGNNRYKIRNIGLATERGLHVLSDKPMVITPESFPLLEQAYQRAEEQGVILYDLMTERYNDLNIIQRALMADERLFGALQQGTPSSPAIESESIHHFIKMVSGAPMQRPMWYYDVEQQGDGIADVTTHLIDQIMWKCFPEEAINYRTDVVLHSASRWPTIFTKEDYQLSTGATEYPDYLLKDVKDDLLSIYANGKMEFAIRGVHVSLVVEWHKQAPEGTGDRHKFIVRGSNATLSILQGEKEGYQPRLYVERAAGAELSEEAFLAVLNEAVARIAEHYPGLSVQPTESGAYLVDLPAELNSNHESHFNKVVQRFVEYVKAGKQPEWEVANTLSKYYITTQSLSLAKEQK